MAPNKRCEFGEFQSYHIGRMEEEVILDDERGTKAAAFSPRSNGTISFGFQMLAIGAGFCMFIMLLALFAAVQHRKRRRSSGSVGSFRSPLIHKRSYGGNSTGGRLSQAIPPPPAPQYLRCSNQSLRKCSSPGGSDYSLSSSYSSSAASAHSLSPMSPYGHGTVAAGYQQQQQQQSPFAALNFIPYGAAPPEGMEERQNANIINNKMMMMNSNERKRHSINTTAAAEAALMGTTGVPELELGPDGARGSVSLQMAYEPANLALQITVLACNGLPKFAGSSAPLNPYLKLRLLPEGQHRVKTRILRDTREPIFDESFTMYGLSGETIRNCRLHMTALAFDRYNGDTVIGEAVYDLAEFCADGFKAKFVSLKWQARNPFEGQKLGKALIDMDYERKSRTVKFSLLQMNDLPRDASLGLLDPYAKVYALINGQKRVAKQKTRVMRRTLSPVFSAEDWLEFVLPESVGMDGDEVPRPLSFNVVLFNHDGVKRNEPIGHFTVDAESALFNATFKKAEEGGERAEWHAIMPF
ncbi:hypothetical protein niasHT_014426 [Heterodera trifolii]|uniref:C2 domain-containing protein n=1 Tax=Heterodera trifolii TaxID=157864 RepID=A0ABD2LHI1_9BILA